MPFMKKPKDSQAMETDADALALAQSAFQHARAGNTGRLAWLVAAGLPVNLCNERGDTLLMLTSYYGHLQATRLLLEHKADPDRANDQGKTSLAGAAFKGDVAMIRLLLDHEARVDGSGPDGKTPLMYAAMFDRVDVMELLLARGAVSDHRDAEGRTALDYARAMGAERAKGLLEQLPSARGQSAV